MSFSEYINRIGHLGIMVPDVDEAAEFYVNKLGFTFISRKLVIDPVDGAIVVAFVKLNNMLIELFMPVSLRNEVITRKNGVYDHFAIDCGNVEMEYQVLKEKGLKLHKSTPDGAVDYLHLGCQGVNFSGSYGEVVEFCRTYDKDYKGVDVSKGWSHLAVKVLDLNKTTEFYERLGFRKIKDGYIETPYGNTDVIFLELKGFILEVIQFREIIDGPVIDTNTGIIDHFALDTSDAANALVAAKQEGFKVLTPVVKELNLFEKGIAYFVIEGPDGELIEINQVKKW